MEPIYFVLKIYLRKSDDFYVNKYIVLYIILAALIGCEEKMDPNPEKSDLIYIDLKKEEESWLKAYGALTKEYEKAKSDLSKTASGTEERENAIEVTAQKQQKAQKAFEHFRMASIQAEKRLKQLKKDYLKSFQEKKPWPNQEEYKEYLVNKDLQNAPREWSPERRIKKKRDIAEAAAKAKAAAEHGESGGHH